MTQEAYKRAKEISCEFRHLGLMRGKIRAIEVTDKPIGIVCNAHDEAAFAHEGFRDHLLQAIKRAVDEYEAQITKEFEEL